MEQRYGTDPSNRYGTGVWNGCGPGPCSGPYNLTCTLLRSTMLISSVNLYKTMGHFQELQAGAPSVISWFIITINYRYNPPYSHFLVPIIPTSISRGHLFPMAISQLDDQLLPLSVPCGLALVRAFWVGVRVLFWKISYDFYYGNI